MDKQIIIDGVDVKKCVYHESGYCSISKKAYCYCCDKPNCHYKNWQRKEQEYEALGQAYLETNELLQEKTKECTNLKAENEGFKILHKSDKGLITSTGKMNYKLLQEYDKLKTALTEIKQIASREAETSRYNGSSTWKQILQKISEVEE